MAIMKEQDPRFANIERKVGAFLLVALIGIACVVVFVGFQQNLFTRTVGISFVAESGKDLREGQAVEFRGFKIGKVKRVSLNDDGKVEVQISVYQEYMKWIRGGSKAKLVKDMLIGDGIIDILPSAPENAQVQEGGRILFEREKGLGEMVAGLKDDISPAIEDIKRLIEYLEDPKGDLRLILENIRGITRYAEDSEGDIKNAFRDFRRLANELPETRAQVIKILADMSRELGDVAGEIRDMARLMREQVIPDVGTAVSNLDQAVGRAEETLSVLNQGLPARLERLDQVLANLQEITQDMKRTSPHLADLALQMEGTAREARKTLEALQDLWFLRTERVGPQQRVLKADSYE